MGICQMDGLGQTGPKRTQSKKLANQKHTNSKCPKEMRLYNGMCYRVFGTELGQNKTFDEAKKACADDGMSLVSITDPYEQAFVTALLGETKTSTDAWIGMEITKGKMMWIDQEPTSFTRFAPTNRMIQLTPGKYLFQNDKTMGFSQDACVSMDGTDMIGYWDTTFTKQSSIKALFGALMTSDQLKINDSHKDDTCDKMKLPYICEKYAEKEEKPQEEKKMPLDAECETHETRGSTYCFLRSTVRAPLTYEEAQKQCEALQKTKEFDEFTDKGTRESQLAVVDDIIEWSFLMSHALHHGIDHFWMGYRFNENTGFQRNDGGRVNIGPWGENQPNLQRGKCVQTTLGPREIGAFWEMEFCEVERPVVCRIADKLPMPIKEPTHKCPDDKLGWILGTTQCYMLVSNSSQISTGYKADHDCFRLFNAHLASFPTAEDFKLFVENEKVKTLIVGTAFIGLVNQNGKFGYTDHSPITFTNWAENQPSSSVGRVTSRDCVHMQLSGEHKWFSENCWTSKHYVCSVPNVLVKEKHQDMSKEGGKKGDEAKTGNLPPLPDETAADSKPDPETPANKDPAPALDPAGQNPPHEVESSNWVTVTLLFLLALVATGTVVVYKLRQKRLAYRMHDHQIMHFDTLQNEDDDGL
ncbi:hypothetical protein L596_023712 [Steinernema carpocapsae]|uniref:C-type lectin domain-containing protein n=1 Tax=Steinernema carpocapsae TaxID=34508 RepID=A0A4U5MEG4_STECR|nr:hypothetical protein L596_023712 [Steinernema carpocapsae]